MVVMELLRTKLCAPPCITYNADWSYQRDVPLCFKFRAVRHSVACAASVSPSAEPSSSTMSRKQARKLKESEEQVGNKEQAVQKAKEQIHKDVLDRGKKMKQKEAEGRLESELKFARRLVEDGNRSMAASHFAHVARQARPDTWLHEEATLQLGLDLVALGDQEAAEKVLGELVHPRAMFPIITRRARHALERLHDDPGKDHTPVHRQPGDSPSSYTSTPQDMPRGAHVAPSTSSSKGKRFPGVVLSLEQDDEAGGADDAAAKAGDSADWGQHWHASSPGGGGMLGASTYLSGYDSVYSASPEEKRREEAVSAKSALLMSVLPWCVLLVGPLLVIGILLHDKL